MVVGLGIICALLMTTVYHEDGVKKRNRLLLLSLPVFELGEHVIVKFAALVVTLVVWIRHVFQKKVYEDIFLFVYKLAVIVAPFAVVFVKGFVRLAADHGIFGKRHSAALAG